MSDYTDKLHAMQSGVAMKMNYEPAETSPKQLRVGVNSAMCDHAALVRVLIEKGILTEAEYMAAITNEMGREVERLRSMVDRAPRDADEDHARLKRRGMKITIESTTQIVDLNGVPSRIWEGTTDTGIAVHCLVTRIAVHKDADATQFYRELEQQRAPSPDLDGVYPQRMVL